MNDRIRNLWEILLRGYTSVKGAFQKIVDDINIQILFVLVYALAFFNSVQWPYLLKQYTIEDDFPQHLLWLYQFKENFFQPNDIYVEMSRLIQPWGYSGLVLLLSQFFDPVTISKFFPVVPLFFTCLFTFLFLKKHFGVALGLGGMILMSNVPFRAMIGFFARGFAFPAFVRFSVFLGGKAIGRNPDLFDPECLILSDHLFGGMWDRWSAFSLLADPFQP